MEPSDLGEKANPFTALSRILIHGIFSRVLIYYVYYHLNKLLSIIGVWAMAAVPLGLITLPFIDNVNKIQNQFTRPERASTVFLIRTFVAIWLENGA